MICPYRAKLVQYLPIAGPIPWRYHYPAAKGPGMNLQQLWHVVATVKRGTMTAAARAVHVAEPVLSRGGEGD